MRGPAAIEEPLRPAAASLKLRGARGAARRCSRCRCSTRTSPYALVLGIDVLIAVLFAASLHFLMGPGGMHSFGHAAYFGLGAYGAALWSSSSALPMEAALLLAPRARRRWRAAVRLVLRAALRRLPGDADARLRADRLVDRVPVGGRHRRLATACSASGRARRSTAASRPTTCSTLALTVAGVLLLRAHAVRAVRLRDAGRPRLAVARRGDRHRRQARALDRLRRSPAPFAGLAGGLFAFAKGTISPETSRSHARSTAW